MTNKACLLFPGNRYLVILFKANTENTYLPTRPQGYLGFSCVFSD